MPVRREAAHIGPTRKPVSLHASSSVAVCAAFVNAKGQEIRNDAATKKFEQEDIKVKLGGELDVWSTGDGRGGGEG
eukprot:CAMPEP_0182497546 /NCGR_PEP_ID=MMETSP1321-20130603/6002_1 /TAXON_ID=91990 /ORGANISM="Bolidomonas sp., Strain RCC1657" /LENGTH=75 /DNA_ID=CAMNT_0024701451 /DNA_START=1350 /DNA_END=1573 /DNA_ORIENTATION=+